jgi:hypothetical protein
MSCGFTLLVGNQESLVAQFIGRLLPSRYPFMIYPSFQPSINSHLGACLND